MKTQRTEQNLHLWSKSEVKSETDINLVHHPAWPVLCYTFKFITMMKYVWLSVLLLVGVASCDDAVIDPGVGINDVSTLEQDNAWLAKLYNEIDSLAAIYDCSDETDWDFTAIGSKACGGAAAYIAYSLELDVDQFLGKVNYYTDQQKKYNRKWGIISDCALVQPPSGVECTDGKPTLLYD